MSFPYLNLPLLPLYLVCIFTSSLLLFFLRENPTSSPFSVMSCFRPSSFSPSLSLYLYCLYCITPLPPPSSFPISLILSFNVFPPSSSFTRTYSFAFVTCRISSLSFFHVSIFRWDELYLFVLFLPCLSVPSIPYVLSSSSCVYSSDFYLFCPLRSFSSCRWLRTVWKSNIICYQFRACISLKGRISEALHVEAFGTL